ncbi:MAG: YciI family protein [Ferruginibacter sp.]
MKMICFFVCSALLTGFIAFGQDQQAKPKKPGDEIEQYWFILLKTGPNKDFDSTAKAKLFEGHMANINKLYYDGILKVAGPFGKNDFTWRGIFIFDCKTKEEAEKIALSDPAVAAGLFAVDIVPWYGAPIGSFTHGKPKKDK